LCNFVTEKEILEILKNGALKAEEIQELTRAGTTCGRCLIQIDEMIERF